MIPNKLCENESPVRQYFCHRKKGHDGDCMTMIFWVEE